MATSCEHLLVLRFFDTFFRETLNRFLFIRSFIIGNLMTRITRRFTRVTGKTNFRVGVVDSCSRCRTRRHRQHFSAGFPFRRINETADLHRAVKRRHADVTGMHDLVCTTFTWTHEHSGAPACALPF